MNRIELTRAEQAALKRADRCTQWWREWTWRAYCVLSFLLPLCFVVFNIYSWRRLFEHFEYVLCARLDGELHPVDFSLERACEYVTICIGVSLLIVFVASLVLTRELRLMRSIVRKLGNRNGALQVE